MARRHLNRRVPQLRASGKDAVLFDDGITEEFTPPLFSSWAVNKTFRKETTPIKSDHRGIQHQLRAESLIVVSRPALLSAPQPKRAGSSPWVLQWNTARFPAGLTRPALRRALCHARRLGANEADRLSSAPGGADAVSAPACAHHHVLRSLDYNALSQDCPEDLKLGVAQLGTHLGCA